MVQEDASSGRFSAANVKEPLGFRKLARYSKYMAEAPICPDCKTQLIQKNPTKLLVVGILMLGFLVGGFFLSPIFWIEAPISLLIGGFLIVWSVKGKGLWCRNCKTFPSS